MRAAVVANAVVRCRVGRAFMRCFSRARSGRGEADAALDWHTFFFCYLEFRAMYPIYMYTYLTRKRCSAPLSLDSFVYFRTKPFLDMHVHVHTEYVVFTLNKKNTVHTASHRFLVFDLVRAASPHRRITAHHKRHPRHGPINASRAWSRRRRLGW